MEKIRIWDPVWKKTGSGNQDKHPGSATLAGDAPSKLLCISESIGFFYKWIFKILKYCLFWGKFGCPDSKVESEFFHFELTVG
jgi:hypothetical protein